MANVGGKITALAGLKTSELRSIWRENQGTEPPPGLSRDLLIRFVAYHIQEKEHGGPDKSLNRKLRAPAQASNSKLKAPPSPAASLKPGAKLIRDWGGKTHCVIVLDDGFDLEGKRYHSLSQVAREITGACWSGPRFFGLLPGAKP